MEKLCDWLDIQQRQKGQRSLIGTHAMKQGRSIWEKPKQSFVKCNVDATVFSDQQAMGLVSMLICNDNGNFISYRIEVLIVLRSVKEGEAIVLLYALHWSSRLGYHEVTFEIDSKVEMNSSWIRIQASEVAHSLARASHFLASRSVWQERPNWIYAAFAKDCNGFY
ncbi:hypothetical protein DITRI_Ditri17bG0041300 [Diplodiscus trichospermus]